MNKLMCLKFLSSTAAILFAVAVVGQVKTKSLHKVDAYQVQSADSIVTFRADRPFSAIAIKSREESSFFLVIDDEQILIPKDEDVDTPTYFLSLPSHQSEVVLLATKTLAFEVFTIHSGESPTVDIVRGRTSQILECADPFDFVPQSSWRDGLQAPDYSRSFHQVFHNVVHHSAGSNSNTNYTQVVRDIYLYHTQVNGWSDIGYNYLISQDGTIYAGRDPGSGSQDQVRGAHFCGANSGTLGVCLLGNYETASPTASSWISLERLLTYQLLEQELSPFDSFTHPRGRLQAVIGHRDGCSTLCPGQNVYEQLDELRMSLEQKIEDCLSPRDLSFEVESSLVGIREDVTFSSTSNRYESYRWLLQGAFPSNASGETATVSYSVPGQYDVMLIGSNGNEEDTLQLFDFIQVSLFAKAPVLFPNPASANELMQLDFEQEIQSVSLFEPSGKLINTWELSPQFRLPDLRPGIYFLTIESEGRTFEKKLILN